MDALFLGTQVVGVAMAVGSALAVSAATRSALRWLFGGLRADPEHEHQGLDAAECGIVGPILDLSASPVDQQVGLSSA